MNELTVKENNQLAVRDEGRAIEEVRASIIIAKKFPRDDSDAIVSIEKECGRLTLAQKAMYCYPRGGQNITGPSVHLLKAIARRWGNIQSGVRTLEQREGESVLEAYAWDMESNTRSSRQFIVKHILSTKKGTKQLTDPRDIYEMEANQGARRLRSCLIDLIPRDVLDIAIDRCEETLRKGDSIPIEQRIAKILSAFAELGIDKNLLESYLKHDLNLINVTEIAQLQKIYVSIKDGHVKREEFFDLKRAKDDETMKTFNQKLSTLDPLIEDDIQD